MQILVSVDCGVRGCGVAVFHGSSLLKATYVKNPQRHGNGAHSALAMARAVNGYLPTVASALAIETMQWYDASGQLGDQNDLGAVQLVAGAITGILNAETVSYLPREWKGTIDGDVCTERIIARLSESERAVVTLVSDKVDHNTWDGVGVGLKCLGRFEPRRTYARE